MIRCNLLAGKFIQNLWACGLPGCETCGSALLEEIMEKKGCGARLLASTHASSTARFR